MTQTAPPTTDSKDLLHLFTHEELAYMGSRLHGSNEKDENLEKSIAQKMPEAARIVKETWI